MPSAVPGTPYVITPSRSYSAPIERSAPPRTAPQTCASGDKCGVPRLPRSDAVVISSIHGCRRGEGSPPQPTRLPPGGYTGSRLPALVSRSPRAVERLLPRPGHRIRHHDGRGPRHALNARDTWKCGDTIRIPFLPASGPGGDAPSRAQRRDASPELRDIAGNLSLQPGRQSFAHLHRGGLYREDENASRSLSQ